MHTAFSPARTVLPCAGRQAHAVAASFPRRVPAAFTRGFRATSTVQRSKRAVLCVASIGKPNPVEGSGLLEAGHTYLDVRTEGEFVQGYVQGATNIPVMFSGPGGMSPNPDFLAAVQAAFPEKDTPFLVGCKSGVRSMKAIAQMQSAGYTDLSNLEGGFDAWAGTGLPAVK